MVLFGLAWAVVIGFAVVHLYHEQQATDRHLCQTNRIIRAEQQKVRAYLRRPPLPPLPPCPPIP